MCSNRALLLLCFLSLPVSLVTAEEKAPVQVASDNVEHDEATGKVTYSGNVVVTRGGMQIISDTLVISRNEESGKGTITASGNPLRFMNNRDGQTVTGNALTATYTIDSKQLHLKGSPMRFQSVDSRGQQLRGSASTADYDMERSRISMSGYPVRFTQSTGGDKQPIEGTSSRADYDINGKLLVLSGNATVKQDGNTVNNDRIVFNMKSSVITAGEKASGQQRVETTLELK